MKKEIILLHHGTYPFDILVCIGSSDEEIIKYLDKKLNYKLDQEEKDQLIMTGIGRTVMLKNGATVIRLTGFKTLQEIGCLAHEVFHAVEFLFDRIGIKHDPEISGEAFAYQIQYVLEVIYKKLFK